MRLLLDPTKTGRRTIVLDENLRRVVVGQDEAVRRIVSAYQTYLVGLNAPGRPVGSFLFLGPTGSGKTRVVEATAETLFHDSRALVKIDCGEFQHSHEIAKLVGSPPGYLGHLESHPVLSQQALNRYHTPSLKLSLVLFDEIEKASDGLWNLLLGILDKGILTLGNNRKVDFSRTMIFMTSNLGARQIGALASPRVGFSSDCIARRDSDAVDRAARIGIEAARRNFTPEFMNRIDHFVTFSTLGQGQVEQILDLELHFLQQRILAAPQAPLFVFTLSPAAKSFVLRQGTDTQYGARYLKRAIQQFLVQPISNLIATEQLRLGDWLYIDWDLAFPALEFTRLAEDLSSSEMAECLQPTLAKQKRQFWNLPGSRAG
jgi:ATP-dependent Clp protease ATP-binding subunit ClpB